MFAVSLANIFELSEIAPTLSVPEPMDLLTLFVMPVTQHVDDLLIDPQYFAELTQALSEGQEVQNLPQTPKTNFTHLFTFAMSLTQKIFLILFDSFFLWVLY